jgi:hypothetical protein
LRKEVQEPLKTSAAGLFPLPLFGASSPAWGVFPGFGAPAPAAGFNFRGALCLAAFIFGAPFTHFRYGIYFRKLRGRKIPDRIKISAKGLFYFARVIFEEGFGSTRQGEREKGAR